MKTKYKYSIKKIYFFCRWKHKYPSENWCVLGLAIRWLDYKWVEYRICIFGIDLIIAINRREKP